ncbi:MAG: class I SAM-dependent methyltransferase [Minisyncoccia bacterium]
MSEKNSKKSKSTSWGGVAHWYDTMLAGDDTYQAKVILPNILRAMAIKKGEKVLDLACGQGFFTRAFFAEGADATGVDLGKQLILIAKKESRRASADTARHDSAESDIKYFPHSAEDLSSFEDGSFEKIAIVLAIQNIEAPHKVFKECSRVLVPGGKLFLVLNHPAFRIPKASSWGFDEEAKTQYRRIDSYMSESKVEIEMNPSKRDSKTTLSFHRPLQYYFKALANNGFAVARLEEWMSHRESEKGLRKKAEDKARKEIPMFLFLEVLKK